MAEEEEAPPETQAQPAASASAHQPSSPKFVVQQEPKNKFTIGHVHVRPGKPFGLGPEYSQWEHCLTATPILNDTPKPYTPMPYTFRLPPAPKPTKIKNVIARSPPMYLLLDHTIAVLWMVFCKKEYEQTPLGIAQLQWAQEFLKTIYNRQGDHPKDVELAIDVFEDLLIDLYANLSEEQPKLEGIDDSMHYADGGLASKTCVTKNFPFSINYADMIDKWMEEQGGQLSTAVSMTSAEAEQEIENIKKQAGVEDVEKLDSVSKEKYINVLRMWHVEQEEKLKEEMKRLRSIEDMIRDADESSFQGYLDAKQLENMLAE